MKLEAIQRGKELEEKDHPFQVNIRVLRNNNSTNHKGKLSDGMRFVDGCQEFPRSRIHIVIGNTSLLYHTR